MICKESNNDLLHFAWNNEKCYMSRCLFYLIDSVHFSLHAPLLGNSLSAHFVFLSTLKKYWLTRYTRFWSHHSQQTTTNNPTTTETPGVEQYTTPATEQSEPILTPSNQDNGDQQFELLFKRLQAAFQPQVSFIFFNAYQKWNIS